MLRVASSLWLSIGVLATSYDNDTITIQPFSIEIVATLTSLADANGSTESIAYDADQNLYFFIDQSQNGEIGSFSGDYPLSTFDADIKTDIFSDVLDSLSSAGAVYHSGNLYVADSVKGTIQVIDVETGSVTQSIYVGAGLKGLCSDGSSTLFATAPGIAESGTEYQDATAGIWSIDLSEDDLQISRLYAGSVSTLQSEDGEPYILRPSACAVKDGSLYIVEERLDLSGSLAVYDLAAESMSLSTAALNVSAEGIVAADYRYFFISSWAHNGGLYVLDGDNEQGVFELAVADLGMVGSLCIGADNVIALSVLDSGDIHLLHWTDAIEFVESETTSTPTTTMVDSANLSRPVMVLIFATCSMFF